MLGTGVTTFTTGAQPPGHFAFTDVIRRMGARGRFTSFTKFTRNVLYPLGRERSSPGPRSGARAGNAYITRGLICPALTAVSMYS